MNVADAAVPNAALLVYGDVQVHQCSTPLLRGVMSAGPAEPASTIAQGSQQQKKHGEHWLRQFADAANAQANSETPLILARDWPRIS